MSDLTADDWIDLSDEDLRVGIGITLTAMTDPSCDPAIVDDLIAFAEDIRAELKRRAAAVAIGAAGEGQAT